MAMDPHAGKIVANGAPSQVDRWPRALAAGYARVDGRTYDELLEFSVGYGALINFFDLPLDRVMLHTILMEGCIRLHRV